MTEPGRRAVLLSGLAALGGVSGAALLGGCTSVPAPGDGTPTGAAAPSGAVALARGFRGSRQAGIVERPPAHAAFVALDLASDLDRDGLRRVLTVWTDDIERLTAGRGTLTDMEPELAAVTASLTVTVGVGSRAVAVAGAERAPWLEPLPVLSVDRLQDRWCGGDLLLQICADSPVTVAHAQRRLTADAAGLAHPRWVQRGFREPFEGPGVPMRNLFGQIDGIEQPALDGPDDALLWVGAGGPAWLKEGSSLVLRRIDMDLDQWDAVDRAARENAIGRRLSDGAPVTAPAGAGPGVPADLGALDALGFSVIDAAAHLRRAHPAAPHERFLRRPYNYDDGPPGAESGGTGLLFAAYQADPVRQFLPVQQRLAERDLLNVWTTPVGSAVFAVLPGARPGEILGERLLA